MKRQFWAKRGNKIAGPRDTREGALRLFLAYHPHRSKLAGRADAIMSGYGAGGPYSDLQWISPLDVPPVDYEAIARAAGWIPEKEFNGEDDGVRSPCGNNWAEDWRGACLSAELI